MQSTMVLQALLLALLGSSRQALAQECREGEQGCVARDGPLQTSMDEDVTSLLMTGIQLHKSNATKLNETREESHDARDLLNERTEDELWPSKKSGLHPLNWFSPRRREPNSKVNKVKAHEEGYHEELFEGCDKNDIKCKFESSWEPADNILTLTLVKGNNLVNADYAWIGQGKSDAYCRACLIDGKRPKELGDSEASWPKTKYCWSSPSVKDTLEPTWNFKFSTAAFTSADYVEFECYDVDLKIVNKDDPIGNGRSKRAISLTTQNQSSAANIDAKDEVVHSHKGSGRLHAHMLTKGRNDDNIVVKLVHCGDHFCVGDEKGQDAGTITIQAAWSKCQDYTDVCDNKALVLPTIAGAIYQKYGQIDNWHLVKVKNVVKKGQDIMGLYRRRGTSDCALAFSGSNDLSDWGTNLNARQASYCGRDDLHKGFADEASQYLSDPDFVGWSKIIQEECKGEAWIVGHSLGGAVASVVAFCANNAQIPSLAGADNAVIPFWATGLYTIGAPSVAKKSLHDHRAEHDKRPKAQALQPTGPEKGCFKGFRIFNTHARDIVPILASIVGFEHPKVDALDLQDKPLADNIIECEEERAVAEAPWVSGTEEKQSASEMILSAATDTETKRAHNTDTYVNRLGEMVTNMEHDLSRLRFW
jgi:hypothetical protein